MDVLLFLLTDRGEVLFAMFWDMAGCTAVSDMIRGYGVLSWCVVGVPL